ncbi:MAG: hypothetical protein S4CHLAM102_05200 [Chlamydiia bacterium]|nr:hypothetical protein [Chlamydiia bacterium]
MKNSDNNKTILLLDFEPDVTTLVTQAQECGIKVVALIKKTTSNPLEKDYLNTVDHVIKADYDSPEVLRALQKLSKKEGLRFVGVFCFDDKYLPAQQALLDIILLNAKPFVQFEMLRDKFAVNQTLAANKLATIPSILATSKEQLEKKLAKLYELPDAYIVKPSSGGSDSRDVQRIVGREALLKLFDTTPVTPLLVQPEIDILKYNEFIVDVVSVEGEHYVHSVLKVLKDIHADKKVRRLAITNSLSAEEKRNLPHLTNYVKKALDALEITDGVTHFDLFWDRNETSFVIEINLRNAGSNIANLYDYIGLSHPIIKCLELQGHITPDTSSSTKKTIHGIQFYEWEFTPSQLEKVDFNQFPSYKKTLSCDVKKEKCGDRVDEEFSKTPLAKILMCNTNAKDLKKDIEKWLKLDRSSP